MQIRYFAAARAATGLDEEIVDVPEGASVAEVAALLGNRHPDLAAVLTRCSFLLDEIAVRDVNALANGVMLDVLPPFAGG
ncbi:MULTISPECIES: MoaD/ThiS family protein [Tsukamurella]|uniref:Molybdopterin synthase sulfur carrier subunit n=1 Tax=Tsukamurella strandjordii TaxID=147577 RepID=A0AA90N7T7_9ACTN|nr:MULTISPECIES: MoaD/ThiS family protein [Tsukamurella]MDP0396618.1 MoaD/ThiS family protein [Tsukamurella strandjordii]GIZ96420.1 molybdopterin synthase sulfur carrier subunit [Tsukamurella sp. TY48]